MPTKNPYSVHPSLAMIQNVVANMKAKTGRTVDEWIALIAKEGPPEKLARRAWLTRQHGLGTNYAWWLADRAGGIATIDGDPEHYLQSALTYVEQQYAGKKAALKPLYARLLALGLGLGRDVKVCPGKTMVPFYRTHVFAQIKATSQTRIDLGLALKTIAGKCPRGWWRRAGPRRAIASRTGSR